ncbi:hypothetical protein TI05_07045, partial [Achromatium sp. WMS3]
MKLLFLIINLLIALNSTATIAKEAVLIPQVSDHINISTNELITSVQVQEGLTINDVLESLKSLA